MKRSAGRLKPGPFDDNQLKAKLDAGIRFVNSVTLVEVGTQDEIVARFDKSSPTPRRRMAQPAFPEDGHQRPAAVHPHQGDRLARGAGHEKIRAAHETHFLESPQRLPEQRAKFEWYVEAGALGPNLIFGHFIHPTPDMIATAAKAGVSMSWQPMSNGRLASGTADIVTYRAVGMKVGVGLDGGSCADTFDPFGACAPGSP